MLPIENELIRLQILYELYEYLFCICNYGDITTQEYRITGTNKCQIIAALYYLNDTGFINVRTTNTDDVLIIFIRARGIDAIELKIKKANTVALTFSFNKLLTPNFDDVPDNSKSSL
jgi:hypothetical protein